MRAKGIFVKKTVTLLLFISIAIINTACSRWQHNKEANCLNPASNCYVPDVTAPEITAVAIYTDSTLTTPGAPGSTVSTLYAIDITYSEVMLNADDADQFRFTGGAGDSQLSISSIEKLSSIQYRYRIAGKVRNGAIKLETSATDVSKKSLQVVAGLYPVEFTGSTDVSIGIASIESNYLTVNVNTSTEYNDIDIAWSHDYVPDNATNVTRYWVNLNAACSFSSSEASNLTETTHGSNFSAADLAAAVSVTTNLKASVLPVGNSTLYICVENVTENKQGYAAIPLVRDDTLPTSRLTLNSPGTGNYASVQSVETECTDPNCSMIAYTQNSSDPTFSLGAITNGTQYLAAWSTPWTVDPTTTVFRFRAMDRAGNVESSVHEYTYTIDTRVPVVTLTSNLSHQYLKAGVTTSFSFSSNLNGNHKVLLDVPSCPASGDGSWSGATSTTKNTDYNYSFTADTASADFTTEGVHTILVCVKESETGMNYVGTLSRSVMVDFTVPKAQDGTSAFAGIASATPIGTDIILTWTAATDASPVYYDIYESTSSPVATAGAASYSTEHATTAQNCSVNDITKEVSCTLTGKDANTVYYYVVRARDKAGNAETNTVEKQAGYTVKIARLDSNNNTVQLALKTGTPLTQRATLAIATQSTSPFNYRLDLNEPYSVEITSQPPGRVCAIKEKQFGTVDGVVTMNMNCSLGYMVGGRYQQVPAAPLNMMLYRGKVTDVVISGAVAGMTYLNGNLYFINVYNRISKWDGSNVTHIAGNDTSTRADGACSGVTNQIHTAYSLTTDGTNLYFTENSSPRAIRKISDPSTSSCKITTLYTSDDTMDAVEGIVHDGMDALYLANRYYKGVVKFQLSTGTMTTIQPASAFVEPMDLTLLNNKLYVANFGENNIKVIDLGTGNIVETMGAYGFQDGRLSAAKFYGPYGITTDGTNLFVSEYYNQTVRRINLKNNTVSTIAGASGVDGTNGTTATGVNALFNNAVRIVADGRSLYVSNRTSGHITKITDSGLVGYWPLNGTAVDYSSDGTSVPDGATPSTTSGRYATTGDATGSYSFDGVDDYIFGSGATLPQGTSPSTMCAWVKPTLLPINFGDQAPIVSYGGSNVKTVRFLGIKNNSGIQKIIMRGWTSDVEFSYTLSTIHWSHVCATFVHNGTNDQWIAIYVNGKIIGKGKTPSDWSTGSGSYVIGGKAFNGGGEVFFNGSIADVRIYSRALNDGEINELAQDAGGTAMVGSSYNTAATGLLSHYGFDDADGIGVGTDPSLTDAGSLVHAVTNNSATTASGKEGDANGAFQYDGSNQYLDSTSDLGLPKNAEPSTVCAWIKPKSYATSLHQTAVSFGLYSNDARGLAVDSGRHANFHYENANSVTGTAIIPLNAWTHICGVYNGTQATLFTNGSLDGLSAESLVLTTESGSFEIGKWVLGTNYFPGTIDDVRIYNNALTSDQIRQLASQIPAGLVARYDLNGDAKDASGWGNHGTASGSPSLTQDRFGQANAAYGFAASSSQNFEMSGSLLPTGKAARTICAWGKRSTASPGSTQYMVGYGANSDHNGQGLANNNGSHTLYVGWTDDVDFPQEYVGTWNFYCGTYDGADAIFYINGAAPAGPVSKTSWNTSASNLFIGAFPGPEQFWDGQVDEVSIYNRVLTPAEIQALTNQPNKRISVSTSTTDGKITAWNGGSYTTGILGADALCQNNFGSTYKAMIVDDGTGCSGAPCRRACTTANCATPDANGVGIQQNINWVLRPGVTYIRSDGVTPIFTANWNGVFEFGAGGNTNLWPNSVEVLASEVWTGINGIWKSGLICDNWTDNTIGTNGNIGSSAGRDGSNNAAPDNNGALYDFNVTCNDADNKLYCVEQ